MHPHGGCSSNANDSALLALGVLPHSKREVVEITFDSIFRASERSGESISRDMSKSETYKISYELSTIEYHRLPQDMTGEKTTGSLHKSVLRSTKFQKIPFNGRKVCGRHILVHTLLRYLDIIPSRLDRYSGRGNLSSKIASWHQKLWVFSCGAALSMPEEDSDLKTNQALSCWQISRAENIWRGWRVHKALPQGSWVAPELRISVSVANCPATLGLELVMSRVVWDKWLNMH